MDAHKCTLCNWSNVCYDISPTRCLSKMYGVRLRAECTAGWCAQALGGAHAARKQWRWAHISRGQAHTSSASMTICHCNKQQQRDGMACGQAAPRSAPHAEAGGTTAPP